MLDYCDPAMLGAPPPYDGCSVYPLQWFTDPEGIKTVLEYDGIRNVTKTTRHPRPDPLNPGAPAPAPIVTSAEYDVTHPKSATKPLWTRDANGHVTRYTYAAEHGGVLTETGPAVGPGPVTPQKRYAYQARRAWIANGSGGYVQAGPPIWLPTQISSCKAGNPAGSGTGCALGAGDEVVTSFDYGPDSGPNNLMLRATTVTADGTSLRTCIARDPLGNKVSETSPRGGCQ